MQTSPYLILGGGMVAGYAAKEFVERGLKPEALAIVSSDTVPPYERPPLSKGFLAGRDTQEGILINDPAFYRDHGIALHLDTAVERVDFREKKLRARNGGEFGFDKLLIATGARPRTLTVPGATLDGVLYLRSLPAERFPSIARVAPVIGGHSAEQQFEIGLAAVIEGIADAISPGPNT